MAEIQSMFVRFYDCHFRFQLISFNDYGREINRNVRLEVWIYTIFNLDLMEHSI